MDNNMKYDTLLLEQKDDIAIVKVNRPEALNAVNVQVLDDLSAVFSVLKQDDAIRAIILTGEGRAFVAGADIAAMRALDMIQGRDFMLKFQAVTAQIEAIEKPVIAAVNGFAFGGGCELCMACDIRFASEKAKFGQPEVALGIIPGAGGTQRLQRLVGKGMAKYLIFSGETIDAEEALRIGLVQRIFPAEALMEKTEEYLRVVLGKAPLAVRMAKVAINNGANADLATGVAFEAEAMTLAFGSQDRVEGMSAFLEKRPAKFQNK